MGIFYREKTFHAGEKIRKNDFSPSEKYVCYAPVVLPNSKKQPEAAMAEREMTLKT